MLWWVQLLELCSMCQTLPGMSPLGLPFPPLAAGTRPGPPHTPAQLAC